MLTTCLYFSYIYVLKKRYRSSGIFAFHAFIAVVCLVYYIYMGNPDRAVEGFKDYVEFIFD